MYDVIVICEVNGKKVARRVLTTDYVYAARKAAKTIMRPAMAWTLPGRAVNAFVKEN